MVSSTRSTSGMRVASGSRWGSAVNRPSVCPRMTSRSASTRLATMAERLSLSPKNSPASSSTATTSFSLIMGTTPRSISWVRVLRTFR